MEQSEVRERLLEMAEDTYREFNEVLIPGENRMLGIRIPKLRRLAQQIAKDDWQACLDWKVPLYFEEKQLQAFCIGYARDDIDTILAAADQFIPTIDNWSVNDSFCQTFKITRKYPERVWEFLMKYRESEKEFEVRVVAVMLMSHYLLPDYIEKVLEVLGNLPVRGYYTSMGIAWAFATAWAKFPGETKRYLTSHEIDEETYRKTLQKCLESYRISPEDKEWIREERKTVGRK